MRPGKEPPEGLEGTAPAALTGPGVVSAPPARVQHFLMHGASEGICLRRGGEKLALHCLLL